MEGGGYLKRAADQMKRLMDSKSVPFDYDIDAIPKVPCKRNTRSGDIPDRKQQGKKSTNNKCHQCNCVMCMKSGMPEHKYKLHSS